MTTKTSEILNKTYSLGVHISKVRSITLDAWEPEQLKVMTELGNDIINV
jgi:Arf-GAP/coiled-coil/ANK repeat/PH domain-containing protein